MAIHDKKMKTLLSNVITGNKEKAESQVRELIESVLLEKEKAILDSVFVNIVNSKKEML
jgi:hypothetical protein